MLLNKEQIQAILPHRAPFLLVDNLIDAGPDGIISDFTVLSDTIFLEENRLREFALIEHIAQSAAVGLIYLNRESRSKPNGGLFGGISQLTLFDLPAVGDTVQTTVTLLHRLSGMYLLNGACFASGKKMLECRVKLVGLMTG